ncbi:hypothetical protein PSEUDO9AG_60192 [Pseudomonas sp. 9Ag]|nr:hypothetical protein PSEUDO9AG_60192 [Pseudomonas sp. 9Ag]
MSRKVLGWTTPDRSGPANYTREPAGYHSAALTTASGRRGSHSWSITDKNQDTAETR